MLLTKNDRHRLREALHTSIEWADDLIESYRTEWAGRRNAKGFAYKIVPTRGVGKETLMHGRSCSGDCGRRKKKNEHLVMGVVAQVKSRGNDLLRLWGG